MSTPFSLCTCVPAAYWAVIGLESTIVTEITSLASRLEVQCVSVSVWVGRRHNSSLTGGCGGAAKLHDGKGQPGACGGDLVVLWTPVGSRGDSLRQIQGKQSGGENNGGGE